MRRPGESERLVGGWRTIRARTQPCLLVGDQLGRALHLVPEPAERAVERRELGIGANGLFNLGPGAGAIEARARGRRLHFDEYAGELAKLLAGKLGSAS